MAALFRIESLAGAPLELPDTSLQVSPSTFWSRKGPANAACACWDHIVVGADYGGLAMGDRGSRGAKHRNPILAAFASPSSSRSSCSLIVGFPVSPVSPPFPCTSPQNFLAAVSQSYYRGSLISDTHAHVKIKYVGLLRW
ncbi:hypothetical protein F5Y05DRAFT_345493 [Hypoxylon sp. FL0543]|nr:hypothetical protein F5Y05DRAFT_345493 [Hypoxylon sp. FL0543]